MNHELLALIFQAVLIPAIPVVVAYGSRYLRARAEEAAAKTNNAIVKAYLEEATEAVVQAVSYMAQTYVDSLKKQNQFDKAAQERAFGEAKDIALRLLSKEAQALIAELHGDLNLWLETKIEQAVHERKLFTFEM